MVRVGLIRTASTGIALCASTAWPLVNFAQERNFVVQLVKVKVGIGLDVLTILNDIAQRVGIERRSGPAVVASVLSFDGYPFHVGNQLGGQGIVEGKLVLVIFGASQVLDVAPDAVAAVAVLFRQ